jgi:hypothetical protein
MKSGNVSAEYSQWSSRGKVSTRERQRVTARDFGVEIRGSQSCTVRNWVSRDAGLMVLLGVEVVGTMALRWSLSIRSIIECR